MDITLIRNNLVRLHKQLCNGSINNEVDIEAFFGRVLLYTLSDEMNNNGSASDLGTRLTKVAQLIAVFELVWGKSVQDTHNCLSELLSLKEKQL